jgi:hypothetical protein
MPVSRAFAAAQVRRFINYSGFDGSKDGIDELVQAFAECCETEQRVKAVADYLIRTITDFAPKPGHIHQTAEIIAQRERVREEAPSPYTMPGDFEGSLTDGMTREAEERWKKIAETPGDRPHDKAKRELACGILEDLYRRNPNRKRQEVTS